MSEFIIAKLGKLRSSEFNSMMKAFTSTKAPTLLSPDYVIHLYDTSSASEFNSKMKAKAIEPSPQDVSLLFTLYLVI